MNSLISDVENYVTNLLGSQLDAVYVYHNLVHTQRVLETCRELVGHLKLGDEESENLLIAAWFHDTGFIKGAKNHEEESVKIASDFLIEKEFFRRENTSSCRNNFSNKIGSSTKK